MTYKSKFILLIILVVVLIGGGFYVWGINSGYFQTGADTINGCQGSKLVTGFMGKPGKNLVTYNLFGHDVTVNEKITGSLDAIQREVVAANTGYIFDDIQTYNYRSKSGGGGLSMHSWGIALDINPTRNPYQPGRRASLQTDIPASIIQIFNKYGFQWGGDWVGEADPMHFEWYGSGVNGSTIDFQTDQKITTNTAILVDGLPVVWDNGDYNWTLPATHNHTVVITSKGYESSQFDFQTSCFKTQTLNITLNPLSNLLTGRISGVVTIAGGKPPLMPVSIYLDGKLVTTSDVNGRYTIENVRKGIHTIGAKILYSTGVEVTTPAISPQENLQGFNIELGG